MPTLRIDKKPSGTYLSLIESYRDPSTGKPRMRTLANLGKVEDFNPRTLKRVSERLYGLAGGDPADLKDNQIKELGRYNFGYVQPVGHLLDYFKLSDVCKRIVSKHKMKIDLEQVLTLMLIERLNDPCSKLSNFTNRVEYYGLDEIKLHWLYRTLDKLDKYSDTIQEHIFRKGRHLFNQKLDVVFYDVTTFYFESEEEKQGSLRQKGFGKDGKIGKTQIVFGMLIDKHKQPVGYHIFEGSKFEGHTLKPMLVDLKKRYHLDRVIVVADRGMLSKANIELVSEELGLSYIFGERLKSMPKAVQDVFLDKTKYNKQWRYTKNGEQVLLNYYSVWIGDRRVISTYSAKRAKKDYYDRAQRIAKAENFLKTPSKLSAKAKYHYLKQTSPDKFVLNQQKIKRDELFDGILAVSTNVTEQELPEVQVLDQYRHLFKIEQSFRTMKSILEVRPMFHWTDKRIRGHVCMCFISLAMLRNIELRLAKADYQWSENQIIKTLDKMQVSKIEQQGDTYFLRSNITEEQQILQKVFKLKKIKNLTPKSLIIK